MKITPQRDESKFDAWVINRFGERLFQIFFKSYTEKLWGIPCTELDSDFASQRIKKLSLFEAIKGAFLGNRNNKHRTLVDEFAYPKNGAGDVYSRLAMKFISAGGRLLLNTPVLSLNIKESSLEIATSETELSVFDHLISTMPLTQLMKMIGAPRELLEKTNLLRFRNTILVYLKVDGENPFPDQWIYVHAQNLRTGRITNFRNWTETINRGQSANIICLEYWCYNEDAIWSQEDTSLIEFATGELYATKLLRANSIVEGYVQRVPKCYPVYSGDYRETLAKVKTYLDGVKIVTPIGRYGSFKYNNQDHSILMGLMASQNLLEGTQIDLWRINTDYEYQESSLITATGLTKEP